MGCLFGQNSLLRTPHKKNWGGKCRAPLADHGSLELGKERPWGGKNHEKQERKRRRRWEGTLDVWRRLADWPLRDQHHLQELLAGESIFGAEESTRAIIGMGPALSCCHFQGFQGFQGFD